MKLYLAGTGPLNKEEIKKIHLLMKRRLLSFYYIHYEKFQINVFENIKDESTI